MQPSSPRIEMVRMQRDALFETTVLSVGLCAVELKFHVYGRPCVLCSMGLKTISRVFYCFGLTRGF